MQEEQARMHPLSLRFADAGLEQAFSEEQARKTLKPLRAAMIALCVAILVAWALLPNILPQVADARARLSMPMLALLAIFACGYARSYTRNFLQMQQVVLLTGTWATAALLRPAFALSARGAINIEGKGEMRTFLLLPPATNTNASIGVAT